MRRRLDDAVVSVRDQFDRCGLDELVKPVGDVGVDDRSISVDTEAVVEASRAGRSQTGCVLMYKAGREERSKFVGGMLWVRKAFGRPMRTSGCYSQSGATKQKPGC